MIGEKRYMKAKKPYTMMASTKEIHYVILYGHDITELTVSGLAYKKDEAGSPISGVGRMAAFCIPREEWDKLPTKDPDEEIKP